MFNAVRLGNSNEAHYIRFMIFSLGSVNADFQMRLPRQFQPGETLLAEQFVRLSGGKAANRAYLAHKLGRDARLIGRVGDDDLATQALAGLRKAGLALDLVTVAKGMSTAISIIAVPPDAKKTILLAPNANDEWDQAAIRANAAVFAAAPSGALLTIDCEIAPKAVTGAVEAAQACNLRIIIDPAPANRAQPGLLKSAYALTPDAREAGELTGTDTSSLQGACAAARQLAALGPAIICVKLTDGGCVLAHGGGLTHIPPTKIDVVDTTGAGDAFTGALAVALAEDMPPLQAAIFATAASHCAVTRFGSQEAYPTRDEIEALIPALTQHRHEL